MSGEIAKKQCSMCGKEFEIIFFNTNKRSRDGLHAWCKVCCRKAEKERYKLIKEEKIKQVRDWQAKNLPKVKEYKKNWRTKGTDSQDAPTPDA
jgi:hypothetical protein